MSFYLLVCPHCLSVHMPVSFVCSSPVLSGATGIVYPPQNIRFCWHSDGKQMKIGLLDSCPDCPNPSVKHSVRVLFNTSISKAQFVIQTYANGGTNIKSNSHFGAKSLLEKYTLLGSTSYSLHTIYKLLCVFICLCLCAVYPLVKL